MTSRTTAHVLLLWLCAQAMPAEAAIRYVAPTGIDSSNACLNAAAPCETPGHALTHAAAGDTVRIAAGKYKVGATWTLPGTLTISGNWDPTFTIQSAETPTKLMGNKTNVLNATISSDAVFTVEHLTISKGAADGFLTRGGGLRIDTLADAVVDIVIDDVAFVANSAFSGGGLGMVVYDNAQVTLSVRNSRFSKNKSEQDSGAIAVAAVGTAPVPLEITNTRFDRNSSRIAGAISYLGDPDSELTLEGVTFTNNKSEERGVLMVSTLGQSQIRISNCVFTKNLADPVLEVGINGGGKGTPHYDIEMFNNTFSGNRSKHTGLIHLPTSGTAVLRSTNDLLFTEPGLVAVRLRAGTTLERQYGIFGDIDTSFGGTIVDGPSVLSVDPGFVKDGKDIHLADGSPAIDSGTCTGAPSVDFEGDARPDGAGCDMGADEH